MTNILTEGYEIGNKLLLILKSQNAKKKKKKKKKKRNGEKKSDQAPFKFNFMTAIAKLCTVFGLSQFLLFLIDELCFFCIFRT